MAKFKLLASTKILDFVEGLPRFRKGTVSTLQDIRERQKKFALEEYARRTQPKGTGIELNQITLILTFEHENFHTILRGLKRYFPKNEKIKKFVKTLKESENDLHAANWSNLGYIAREQGVYLSSVAVDDGLPEGTENVSLSFHRILPSVACLIFEFQIDELVSIKLNNLQDQSYLGPVEFKKLWPLRNLGRGYSMGMGYQQAIESINNEKDSVRKRIDGWVKKSFGWQPQAMDAASYIDVYKIRGNPTDIESRQEWFKENRGWLSEYGVYATGESTYEGDDFILSSPRSDERKYVVSDIVSRFDSKKESEFRDFLEFKVRAIAVSSTIFSVVEKYRSRIEVLRGRGFKNLYKSKKLTQKNQSNIQNIKKTVAILSRLENELRQSEAWISHSISEVGQLRDTARNESVDLGKNTILNSKYQLKKIQEAANIIDAGLTNYLSVQSIYVMYKLQKWMFILSIVVTLATIIGVLSGWGNIKGLVLGWVNA